jgi:uncharacterized membrane protein (DUF4010 family)
VDAPQDGVVGLAVALGAGLLIGIERERRKGLGDDRQAAGLRSFAVVAATGALAQWLAVPGLVVCGAGLVAALAALSHWKSRSRDPGLTTELALFTTYLIGVQCVLSPAFGGACGVGLAALLAARERLHQFATQLLSEQELHDGLLLAAFGLIVLPLIPSGPLAWLGGIDPRPLASLVLLILAIQAAGHVALRWLGPRGGLLLSGLVSGFVSSTATVASFGSRARSHPDQMTMLAGGAALSSVATWLQALVMSSVLSPGAALAIWPIALAGALGGTAVGLLALNAHDGQPPAERPQQPGSALRPREAFAIALLLAVVALAVGSAQRHFGDAGLNVSVAIASLVDAHAPVASLASLHAAGSLSGRHMVLGVLIAITTNSLSRCAVAAFSGGPAYARRVGAALAAGLVAAWTVGLTTSL